MGQAKILVVDDEQSIVDTVRSYLEHDGFIVRVAADGPEALRVAHQWSPDLVVLDIMLPGLDGLEVLRRLRLDSVVYVLLLTARAEEIDRVIGLTVGADDYLTKPFSPRELVARIRAILRRGRGAPDATSVVTRHLRLEPASRRAWADEQELELTAIEFDLLAALLHHRGRVLSREQLIEQVWGYDYYGDERVVDVHVGRLRRKLEAHPAAATLLVTVRGVGYRLEDEKP